MLLRQAPSVRVKDKGFVAYGFSAHPGRPVIDAHRERMSASNLKVLAASLNPGGPASASDAHFWLPQAAEELNISRNIRDYLIVPDVPTVVSDIPNTNGVAFPKQQLLGWNPTVGRMAYKTFKGKSVFQEHDNTDISKSAGVILDCYLLPCPLGIGLIQLIKLLAIDRDKYPDLAADILSGKKNCYSMGAYFQGFEMSDGSRPHPDAMKKPLFANERGELVYKMVMRPNGFETSVVSNPAWAQATNTSVLTF